MLDCNHHLLIGTHLLLGFGGSSLLPGLRASLQWSQSPKLIVLRVYLLRSAVHHRPCLTVTTIYCSVPTFCLVSDAPHCFQGLGRHYIHDQL